MKIISCKEHPFARKQRSPACRRRNAKRIKEFIRKKRLQVFLPNCDVEDKKVESLIQKVELENSSLVKKLDVANKEITKLQKRLQNTSKNYQEELNEKKRELFEAKNIIDEKENVIELQRRELRKTYATADRLKSDLNYTWDRIHRCEGKIRHLIEQLETLEQSNRHFSRRSNFYR